MTTIDERIAAKREQLGSNDYRRSTLQHELDALLAEKAALPKLPWVPREGGDAWLVYGNHETAYISYYAHHFAKFLRMGMIAPTREAAERKARRIAVFNKLWDLAEASGEVGTCWWQPIYGLNGWIAQGYTAYQFGLGRFATEESCAAAIAACDMSALVHEGTR